MQLSAIERWVDPRRIFHTVDLLPEPPALLDMRHLLTPKQAAACVPGICLTVTPPAATKFNAQLCFWITRDGKKSAVCSFAEGDQEICAEWFPDFESTSEMTDFIEERTTRFLLEHLFGAALDEWAASKGIRCEECAKPSSVFELGAKACHYSSSSGFDDWLFIEVEDGEGYGVTLGISGRGESATFTCDEEGFLEFDLRANGLKTGTELIVWIEGAISKHA